MITTDEIRAMLLDVENDRVERTISTTNTDKFGQAICAFANDLPNHKQPGYLFLGVTDDGAVSGINVTDELLKNIAAIRTDGNIQPQPSMVVQKVPMPEGDIIMVEVQPGFLVSRRQFPPQSAHFRFFQWNFPGNHCIIRESQNITTIDIFAAREYNIK